VFGPQSRDRVRQTTYGLAYDGRWRSVGELSFGLSRTAYRKTTEAPDAPDLVSRASPWLYNGTAAIFPTARLALYAGYARGLEESGTPPPNAANRNQALPAILTRQVDGGLRLALTDRLKAVAGLFDLRRPDFGFDTANRYVQTGSIRSRGAEFSLAGDLTRRLDIVAGGVFLDATTQAQANAAEVPGKRPVGIPAHILSLSANWKSPLLAGLSLDASVSQTGTIPATTDDSVEIPPRTIVNLGGRYSFKLGKTRATARLQLANLFDQRGFSSAGPGAYSPNSGRAVTGYLAVDL
jgi:iron complex outermembrane receptor protein